jgi:FSR family fosmidomycin resistance protein-like MFS transporter
MAAARTRGSSERSAQAAAARYPVLPLPSTAMATVAATGRPIPDVRPRVSLALLSAQHALIHAQSALLPLVLVEVVREFGVGVASVGLLLGVANLLSGSIQLGFGPLSRAVARPRILGGFGLVFGLGTSLMAATTAWLGFSAATIVSRLGGSPQHTVGHALLSEQFPPERRASAISTHIAVGNLGTVAVPLVGGWLIAKAGWQPAVLAIGLPALMVAAAILVFVRQSGTDRAAAIAAGSTWSQMRSLRHERDLLWLYLASSVAAAGRGIGVVTTFVPLYLSLVLGLDAGTIAVMYTLLLVGSVPGPLVAGWLADRYGHRPVLVATYLLGAASLAMFVLVGDRMPLVWVAIGFMSAFVYEESSLLQALLADVARPAIRDVAFATYFTLMFIIGAAWLALLGWLIGALGNDTGFPVAFMIMSASFVLAGIVVTGIRSGARPDPATATRARDPHAIGAVQPAVGAVQPAVGASEPTVVEALDGSLEASEIEAEA